VTPITRRRHQENLHDPPMRAVAVLGLDTVTWRVNHEPVAFMGGGRALLLQVAHPLVAAGVEQHSNYDADPRLRLRPTNGRPTPAG
jgi:uncharacterized protein (DUF2236 family)